MLTRFAAGCAVAGLVVVATSQARAQGIDGLDAAPSAPAASEGPVTPYAAGFFTDFKPTSAFDMVQRLPGFAFDGGADVRGFGGAAGNVLIDGQRPSSKSLGLSQVLQRIPVSQVERIDLVRGGAPGIDMQGRPVVANVIRKAGASANGAVQVLAKPFSDGFVGKVARAEGSWRKGALSVDAQAGGRRDRTNNTGHGRFHRRDAAGRTLFDGTFDADERWDVAEFNTTAEYRPAGYTLRVNLSGKHEVFDRRERSRLTDAAGDYALLNDNRDVYDTVEVGGDYQRSLGEAVEAQVIGVATFGGKSFRAVGESRGPTQENLGQSDSGERILRGVLVANPRASLRLEGGLEGAFNFLDTRQSLTVGGEPVALPSETVRVEEQRGEAFATAVWTASPDLSIEGGLRYERSTISQSGEADQERTLAFPKPRVIVSWAPDGASQLRLRVERVVGQLNFNDFAANAQLDTGQHNAGNPDLAPERSWTLETAFERRFWSSGATVLTLTHEVVESLVDLVPIDGRYDAPGNIGDGWRQSARLTVNLPFDSLGLDGALLKLNTTWRRSEVTDPTTGLPRERSWQSPFGGDFVFTKTFASLDSVFAIEGGSISWRDRSYRITEIRTQSETPFINVYWDWTPRPDLMLRVQVENAAAKTRTRKRALYDDPRSIGEVAAFEKREQQLDPFMMVRARKTF